MSYNIMGKNASFKGDISGTIENQVNDWDNQSISGSKSFAATISSSADVMLSGSGKVSASFFYGDGSGLSGVAAAAGDDREVQFNNGGSALGASSTFTFTAANQLQVTGQISASLGVSGSEFHGDGSNLTAVTASFVTASNVVGSFDTAKITTGTFADARIPNLDTAKITTGTFANARISEASVTQHSASLDIAGGQLTGNQSIANARLQSTVSVVNVTASGHMSASTFHGNGAALTGVSATATPAGTNADIQFNADGVLGSSNRIQFNTGSFTLTATNLSSSGNISGSSLYLQDEIIVGGQAFLDINANVAANNASFVEITASSTISSSADVYGANFRGNGSTLNNVPLGSSNAASIVFVNNETNKTITTNAGFTFNGTHAVNTGGGFKGTTLSASADLQVGGHITGSGDVVLGGTMYWDRTGTGDTTGPKLTPGGGPPANSLNIDGDSIITIQADTNARFRVGTASTPDLILDITPTVVSSSVPITGSALHTNSGITIATGGGDLTFLSDQGKVTAGSIEMVAGGSDVLNFNDNSISGSGNISGSAFYGDGSNLQNMPPPNVRYHYLHAISSPGTQKQFLGIMQINGNTNSAVANYTKFIAPADGQLEYVLLTATDANSRPSDGDLIQFVMVKNEEANSWNRASLQVTGAFDISYTIKQNNGTDQSSFRSKLDLRGNSPVVTGSTIFSEGDFLLFGMSTPGGTINDIGVTIAMTLSGSV